MSQVQVGGTGEPAAIEQSNRGLHGSGVVDPLGTRRDGRLRTGMDRASTRTCERFNTRRSNQPRCVARHSGRRARWRSTRL